jgi:hypothetical protein
MHSKNSFLLDGYVRSRLRRCRASSRLVLLVMTAGDGGEGK